MGGVERWYHRNGSTELFDRFGNDLTARLGREF
jgi:hypothetical protein